MLIVIVICCFTTVFGMPIHYRSCNILIVSKTFDCLWVESVCLCVYRVL